MPQDNEMIDIMKMISAFSKDDFDNKESKEKLSGLFNNFIMSDDPLASEFLGVFIDNVSDIIDGMEVIADEPDEEETEEPTPEPEAEEVPEEEPAAEPSGEEAEGDSGDVPPEMLDSNESRAYIRPMIEQANRYIYE